MSIETFVGELLHVWFKNECMGVDGEDIQSMTLKHGLAALTTATQEDCDSENGLEYGLEVGDPWMECTPETLALVNASQSEPLAGAKNE